MRPEDEDLALVWDMLQAARKIEQFVAGKTFQEYSTDELVQAAVERKLEIIGEAARKISPAFQRRNPDIPWRGIVGQRHFLAHEYGEVHQEKLWRVATGRIPELIAMLRPLLPAHLDQTDIDTQR
jgi:uncharacterized protein with HEPN domain